MGAEARLERPTAGMLEHMSEPGPSPLPSAFCWTRFGTEAGEPIEAILARKEEERLANSGVFYWGIGNSVANALEELLRRQKRAEVLFSPMRGRPQAVDVSPATIAVWQGGRGLDGQPHVLPRGARVTSRGSARRRGHYALVCHSEVPLDLAEQGWLDPSQLFNLLSGRPVGASQVTAVVEHRPHPRSRPVYRVALRAELVAPYFIRLLEPIAARPG